MSFKSAGDPFGVSSYNNLLRQGLGDQSLPGTGEVRLFEESGKYVLRVHNGTEWIDINSSAADILNLLKTVDGTGSGLDADKLDGQDSGYYRDASNLNAGTVPSARLGDLVHDSAGSALLYPEIYVYHLNPGTQIITFPSAFTSTPFLAAGRYSSSDTGPIYLYSISTTGFRKGGGPGCDVIVMGRRTR